MRLRTRLALLAPTLLACAPAPEEPGAAPWFADRAGELGLAFHHESGHRTEFWMPEIVGGGGALFDLEDDGDLDAYLVQSGSLHADAPEAERANQLFENDGHGRFRDVSAGSGAEDPRYGMGVACGDADGDGDTDLFVTNLGRNTLLLNQGAGRFEDVSESSGFTAEGWSTSATFLDHDRDGALDLFVTRYIEWTREGEILCMNPLNQRDYCSPKSYKRPAASLLYRALRGGRFADVSEPSGVAAERGHGLGVVAGDLDGDGWLDVFVANDGRPNHLWRNGGDGRFTNVAMRKGCGVDSHGVPKAGMGVLLADFDDDLDLDVLVCNLRGESDSYFRNDGGLFSDRTAVSGLAAPGKPFTRFGLALGDFDQDGWPDLYEANGRVERPREAVDLNPADPYAEPNLLLRGLGGGRFEELLPRGGTAELQVETTRAVAQGDVDGDGALDLLVVNRDAPARLLINHVEGRGRWILLRVRERSGADALGAVLSLEVAGRTLRRDVATAYGYLASHDPRVHLGLGAAERVDSVLVRWVDGTSERFGPLEAGRAHELRRGQGSPP
ncbi:MAG TPA: CRTAC1 family protein [Planctomycetota bacterium]